MEFISYSNKKKPFITKEIEHVLSLWKKGVDKKNPQIKKITRLLVSSNKPGKTIRGTLVCLGYELFASRQTKMIYPFAAAYELLHTSLLIHDDIMDKSVMRRGKRTVYRQLGGDHYGISQAISLGDAGFFLATKLMAQTKYDEKIKNTVIGYFSQIVLDTVSGQMLDISLANKISVISEKEVISLARYKTAYYTIVGPFIVGALLAGATKRVIKALEEFGEHLGIAFQIQDDLLGVFGEEKKLGKSTTSDIEEGKNTLLLVNAYKNASDEQKQILMMTYGNGRISKKQFNDLKQLFIDTGARSFAEKKIRHHATLATQMIPRITKNIRHKTLLENFVQYLLNRKT